MENATALVDAAGNNDFSEAITLRRQVGAPEHCLECA
jgi:hypothetical protein